MLLEYIDKIKEVTTALISVMTVLLNLGEKSWAQSDANENSFESPYFILLVSLNESNIDNKILLKLITYK